MGGPDTLGELVLFMVILKIPIVGVCTVVYRAIKAEPEKHGGEPLRVATSPRRKPPRPHGGPARTPARMARGTTARAGRIGGQ